MCYQLIYYPSPNFFIKHLDIDKNHIVRYIGAVAAGVVGPPGGGGGGVGHGVREGRMNPFLVHDISA